MQEAFRQESGELRYLENCWSDAAILQFILIGWVGLALKVLLFGLLATVLGACVQGRRPWYVFVGFVKGVGKVVGGLCDLFEVEDEVRVREREAEAGRGVGTAWREEKGLGGYFGSPKQKVSSLKLRWNSNSMLTILIGMIGKDKTGRDLAVGRQCCRGVIFQNIEETEKLGDGVEGESIASSQKYNVLSILVYDWSCRQLMIWRILYIIWGNGLNAWLGPCKKLQISQIRTSRTNRRHTHTSLIESRTFCRSA